MRKTMIIQGREISSKDIEFIGEMIKVNPSWGHSRLSKELAVLWNWQVANGQLKDMACRTFLLKLERQGYDEKGTPFAPCGALCKSNGYGKKKKKVSFVMGITLNLVRYLKTWDKPYKKKLAAPMVLAFMLSLIQRKRSSP